MDGIVGRRQGGRCREMPQVAVVDFWFVGVLSCSTLARGVEVAAAQTLRGLRRDDRKALGRHRVVLQPTEQSRAGLRGRIE